MLSRASEASSCFSTCAARQAAIVGVHREEGLGGEDVAVARTVAERLAEKGFGGAIAIDVGGVDEVDAFVERGVEAAPGAVGLDPDAVGQPRAKRDVGNDKVAAAELALVHENLLMSIPNRRRFSQFRRGQQHIAKLRTPLRIMRLKGE